MSIGELSGGAVLRRLLIKDSATTAHSVPFTCCWSLLQACARCCAVVKASTRTGSAPASPAGRARSAAFATRSARWVQTIVLISADYLFRLTGIKANFYSAEYISNSAYYTRYLCRTVLKRYLPMFLNSELNILRNGVDFQLFATIASRLPIGLFVFSVYKHCNVSKET